MLILIQRDEGLLVSRSKSTLASERLSAKHLKHIIILARNDPSCCVTSQNSLTRLTPEPMRRVSGLSVKEAALFLLLVVVVRISSRVSASLYPVLPPPASRI